jgi:hypothetical protein
MTMERRRHLSGLGDQVGQPRALRPRGLRETVPDTAVAFLGADLVEVDDARRTFRRLRELRLAEGVFALPLMLRELLRPGRSHAGSLDPREVGKARRRARTKRHVVDPFRARHDAVSLRPRAVYEAVAGADLVGRERVPVELPRQPRAREDEEDLFLISLHVERGDRLFGSTSTRFTPTRMLPAALPRSVQ